MSDEKSKLTYCRFSHFRCDDPKKKYIRFTCSHPENTGGTERGIIPSKPDCQDHYGRRTYSRWYENEGMEYRCWNDSERMAQCPILKKLNPPLLKNSLISYFK